MNTIPLKHYLNYALVISLSVAFSSCQENNNSDNASTDKDPKQIAEAHNDAKFDRSKEDDAQFLVEAAEMSQKQIMFGELAAKKAKSAEIKKHGKQMVADHKKLLEEMKALANKKTITIPDAPSEKGSRELEKLQNENADDFDRKYCDIVVDDHKDAIKKFDKIASDSDDFELKSAAQKILPDLRKHLDQFMVTQQKMDKADKDKTTENRTTEK